VGHIVAASRGGSDELGNLGLEHNRCNLAAGDRDEQPRAVIASPIEVRDVVGLVPVFLSRAGVAQPRTFARNGAPADYLRDDASR